MRRKMNKKLTLAETEMALEALSAYRKNTAGSRRKILNRTMDKLMRSKWGPECLE